MLEPEFGLSEQHMIQMHFGWDDASDFAARSKLARCSHMAKFYVRRVSLTAQKLQNACELFEQPLFTVVQNVKLCTLF